MVTAAPTGAGLGEMPVMFGVGCTVKLKPVLAAPPTVTTTLPLVAPAGTLMVMLVALQEVAVPAAVPLKVTVLLPWVAPKLVPVMVTAAPTGAGLGEMPVMFGVGCTVKLKPVLAALATVTTTLPLVAPAGTLMVMLVALQEVAVPAAVA